MKTKWYEGDLRRWRNYDDQYHSEREFQKSKVYAAERTVWSEGKFAERFKSIDEMQAFVNTILTRVWYQKRFPQTREVFIVRKCSGSAYGSNSERRISIPIDPSLPPDRQWAWNKAVVLHELGHVVTPSHSGGRHGRFFARTYLSLVKHVLGHAEYKQLRQAFKAGNVKYGPKMRLTNAERKRRSDSFKKRFDIKPRQLPGMTKEDSDGLIAEVRRINNMVSTQ